MGQFSWIYSDTKEQMVNGWGKDSYLLVPKSFQKKYGKAILEECYDGYGCMGVYDIYELIAEWNQESIDMDSVLTREPTFEQYANAEYFEMAKGRFNRMISVLEKFKAGASDEEMKEFCTNIGYGEKDAKEWKRYIGIEISCGDERNEILKYPIKITTEPLDYDSVAPSKVDPDQGWM